MGVERRLSAPLMIQWKERSLGPAHTLIPPGLPRAHAVGRCGTLAWFQSARLCVRLRHKQARQHPCLAPGQEECVDQHKDLGEVARVQHVAALRKI